MPTEPLSPQILKVFPDLCPWRSLIHTDPWAAALDAGGATDAEAAAVFAHRCAELEARLAQALMMMGNPAPVVPGKAPGDVMAPVALGEAIEAERAEQLAAPVRDAETQRVAEVLGIDPRSVVLCWDGGDEIDPPGAPKILDITIAKRYRPHRSTWQRLVDAGLPICSYDAASLSWTNEETNEELGEEGA